jgi:hypothetical protein
MIKIAYPLYQPKIKKASGKELIFDEVRRQWVVLTPEEWVRQNFLQYLIRVKKYPATLIALEKEIFLSDVKKRFDIVVYDRNTKPWMLVECKEMRVALDVDVLDQALRYNINLQVPYLVITNGTYCYAFNNTNKLFEEINILPEL